MSARQKVTDGQIVAALHAHHGSVSAASRHLGVSRTALVNRLNRSDVLEKARREAERTPRPLRPCPACGGTGIEVTP